ncbi:hypothetical protein DSM25558_4680 [Agrobacterium sp. DSM 25558]|uniref:hypothetical protein n=1 Tax=Agrobacterium sp. DSM 25558 TaxID=1907665 RepID=UPI00097250BE|nr:hypothetical protein [Agrobacterium sp. DSM 25558]SCX29408.1 hypothetical protein DSM25558_4680 [Agrobacterium sp. DSM 25558]
MTGDIWKVTQYGLECGPIEIDNARCTKVKKGRYAAIKEVCSLFMGDESDVEFINAWRELMMWQGKVVDEKMFNLTVKECSRMKGHRFLYAVARNTLSPHGDTLTNKDYHTRRYMAEWPQIESRVTEMQLTQTPNRKGNKLAHAQQIKEQQTA